MSRGLLDQLVDSSSRAGKSRQSLLQQIAEELRLHAELEEAIFYPALLEAAEKGEDRALVHEAFEEHRAAVLMVLPDLEKTPPDGEQFSGRAKVLRELIMHHVEEEEDEMFERARELLSGEQLEELALRMQARKNEGLQQAD